MTSKVKKLFKTHEKIQEFKSEQIDTKYDFKEKITEILDLKWDKKVNIEIEGFKKLIVTLEEVNEVTEEELNQLKELLEADTYSIKFKWDRMILIFQYNQSATREEV